jgi:hypothetical protein
MAAEGPALSSAPVSDIRVYKAGSEDLSYSKPAFWATIGNGPGDFRTFIKNSFSKASLPWWGAIGASTVLLIEYDQKIYDNTRRLGKRLNISTKDKTTTFLKAGGVSLFRGPTDLGSAIYFLGDGWVNIGLCAYFETYGWINDDWRALTTGHQLIEGLLITGFTTQVIKRTTGRETPMAASAPGGVWRFFPSFADFQAHRTSYDAVPSGHMATGMMTITVLADNYPEKKYIKPLGYGLLGLLGFQMVNNGVHWASDYPLGLAVGYGIGKAITVRQRHPAELSGSPRRNRDVKTASSLRFYPSVVPGQLIGFNLAYGF